MKRLLLAALAAFALTALGVPAYAAEEKPAEGSDAQKSKVTTPKKEKHKKGEGSTTPPPK